MNVNQVLLELTAAPKLRIAHRTRELRLFTAILAFMPRQRWFPRVFLAACVAGKFAAIPSVIILWSVRSIVVTWKESTILACALSRCNLRFIFFLNSSSWRIQSINELLFTFHKENIRLNLLPGWNFININHMDRVPLKALFKDNLKIEIYIKFTILNLSMEVWEFQECKKLIQSIIFTYFYFILWFILYFRMLRSSYRKKR